MNKAMNKSPSPSAGPVVVGVIPGQPAAVLERAAGVAAALGTEIVCAWVDPSSYTRRAGPEGTEQAVPIDPDAADSSAQELTARMESVLTARLGPFEVPWTFQSQAGEPARELARLAARVQASMIVVGTREPGIGARLEELLTGSIAVHLAHHQSCPVMVIPLHPKPFSEAE